MSQETPTPFDKCNTWIARKWGSWATNAVLDGFMIAAFALFCAGLFVLAIFLPGYSFDLVAYLGASIEASGPATDPMRAWDLVRQVAPEDVYRDLAAGNAYRLSQSGDATAFASNLPLYSAKIGYIYMLGAMAPLFGWVQSALWVSHFSGLLLGLLCLVWMIRERCIQAAPVIMAVLLAGNYFDALRYPTPDIIAAVLTLSAIYLWLHNRSSVAMLMLFVAFLFRPDTLIFVFAMMLSCAAFSLSKWRFVLLFAVLLGSSIFIHAATDHPGWWIHYMFSNVQIQNTLVGFDPAFSIFNWAKGQARGVYTALTAFNWPVMLIFALAAQVAMIRSGLKIQPKQSAMLLACILTIGGKFLVFPLPDDRLYMVFILAIALLQMQIIQPRLAAR